MTYILHLKNWFLASHPISLSLFFVISEFFNEVEINRKDVSVLLPRYTKLSVYNFFPPGRTNSETGLRDNQGVVCLFWSESLSSLASI